MTIKDILALKDKSKQVDALKKGRLTPQPDIETFKKQWDPKSHQIFDEIDRPNKTVHYNVVDAKGKETTQSRIEKVARVAVAFQKLIVRRAAAFLFGNPVKVLSSKPGSEVAAAVDKILKANKQKGLNKRVARILFSTTEVAEYWYPVIQKEKFSSYGFDTKLKLKCAVFSPLKGDKLYPFFNDTGDMIAFSREFSKKEDDKELVYFETWTDEKYMRWRKEGGGWVDDMEGVEAKIQIKKIPIVYAEQESVEWQDVQWLIDRFEKLVSNFGDTNDYHGSPKIAVKGSVKGFSKKGDSGGILELEGEGAEAKYLAWTQAPDSIKIEIENLMRLIYSITQTPDISFDAVKGLGTAASGNSLQMLFLDAHLKVMDKMEIFEDYLERRFNIIKAFVGEMNTKLRTEAAEIELNPEVVPFMVDDKKDKIENLVTAVSGKIMSRKTAVSLNPLVADADKENEQLRLEASDAGVLDAIQNAD